jgi:CCR4-NOT transcription complex subunit 3
VPAAAAPAAIPATSSWNSPLNAVKADSSKAATVAPAAQPPAAAVSTEAATTELAPLPTPVPKETAPAAVLSPPAPLPSASSTPLVNSVAASSTVSGASPAGTALSNVPAIPQSSLPASAASLVANGANGIAAAPTAPSGPPAAAPAVSKPPVQLPADALMAITMLKHSMVHTPENIDNDKHSSYAPRNPYPNAHPAFPTHPPPQLENAALFERLPVDTLFCAFYNQPGSYQQYIAARQLKKHSWRFHKKYMTWFQRHEEPKITTEDYEEGTYVYFDYESGWCQRIKSEFKFEYAYLEDEVQSNS